MTAKYQLHFGCGESLKTRLMSRQAPAKKNHQASSGVASINSQSTRNINDKSSTR